MRTVLREVLVCCARTSMEAQMVERIRATLTHRDLDWEELLRFANAHRMLQVLYWNLHHNCPELVPPAILNRLRHQFQAVGRRNVFLTRVLLELLDLLEVSGIRAIPYKGPVLAAGL